jgi:hypothetical protein
MHVRYRHIRKGGASMATYVEMHRVGANQHSTGWLRENRIGQVDFASVAPSHVIPDWVVAHYKANKGSNGWSSFKGVVSSQLADLAALEKARLIQTLVSRQGNKNRYKLTEIG